MRLLEDVPQKIGLSAVRPLLVLQRDSLCGQSRNAFKRLAKRGFALIMGAVISDESLATLAVLRAFVIVALQVKP